MIVALNKAGELIDDEQPYPWQSLEWLDCECGSPMVSPRSVQGHTGKWALCTSSSCRNLWSLSTSEDNVFGTLDGVMPASFHARLTS